ncbi:MAG: carboxypeptidase regulatory-like domain-containing protein [Gemmatimonas sp.]
MSQKSRPLRGLFPSAWITGSGIFALLWLTASSTSKAQSSPANAVAAISSVSAKAVGKIEGTVFDSLTKRPVAGASVWIEGATFSAASDASGRFVLDSLPTGVHSLAFSAPAFDSAGLGTQGRSVTVTAGANVHVQLASPSLHTLWNALCKSATADDKSVSLDSGIAYGTIFDGDNKTRLAKAPTVFTWVDISKVNKKVAFAEMTYRAESDGTGTYYACGLPTDVAVSARAYGNKAASGEIEYTLGERQITRLDFVVSRELVDGAKLRGTSVLHGFVRDEHGKAIGEAVVTAVGADTSVRANADGEFTLRLLPAGTQGVQVRKIGMGVGNKIIDLQPGQTTETSLIMPSVPTLAAVKVRADVKKVSFERADLEERKKIGAGIFIDMEERVFATPASALNMIPRVAIKYGRGGTPVVTMARGNGSCTPIVFLNGMPMPLERIAEMSTDMFKYVEVYNSWLKVPARFMTKMDCGVVLYWTKDK